MFALRLLSLALPLVACATEPRQVWVSRGIGTVADPRGPRFALSMEADPVPLEVTTGLLLGYHLTWRRIEPGGGRSSVLDAWVCSARIQGALGPPDMGDGAAYDVELQVFETAVSCEERWNPRRDGFRELLRTTID